MKGFSTGAVAGWLGHCGVAAIGRRGYRHVGASASASHPGANEAIQQESAAHGAQIVVLPEMWNCPYSNDSFPIYAEDVDAGQSESARALADAARESTVVLVGGSIPEVSHGKLYNTCCVFNVDGTLLGKHRKTHLFDIDIPGKITFQESLTLTAGDALTCIDTPYGRIGLGICYDLRFPEMAMVYRDRGAQLLIYPGAFNMTTGPVHWQLLQQGRALDNQLFVCSCSPARDEEASYRAWGHSMAVGPFGEVLASAQEAESIVYVTLDLAQVAERRRAIPVGLQKRKDLYEVLDKGS